MPKWFLFTLLVLANFIWSGSFTATSIAAESIAPTLIVMTRMVVGGMLLSPALFIRPRNGSEWNLLKAVRIALLGLLGFTLPVTMETIGIHISSPALGAVSIALEPLLTLLVSSIVFHTRLGLRRWFAMALAGVGAWIVAGCPRPGVSGYLAGDLLMLGAVVCYAVYNAVSGRLTADVPATGATSIMLLAGGVGCVPLFLLNGHPWPHHVSPASFWSLVFLAVFATAGAYLVWIVVLQDHDVASAAITLYLQPVFGVLLAIAIVHERPSVYFYAGGVMILLALFLGQHRPRDASRG
ncbi:DMT family transporter [Alicyclobacillus sacchari]|nr:DMT family transporter [Alicyclobacillus sacchari]